MKTLKDIKVLLIEDKPVEDEITKRFLSSKIPLLRYKNEEDLSSQIENLKAQNYKSKEVLILKPFKGKFFQTCPGSPVVICCNYRLINTCFNCLYNCAYCYLNSYLNAFGIIQFTNVNEIFKEIDLFLNESDTDMIYRIGTGEFTDSLMMDDSSDIARMLIERYSSKKNIMIEFKTKSNKIDHLLSIKQKGNTVLSWSLNTERNVIKYEEDAAPVETRIKSAGEASEAGFFLAFHFDPVIIYEGWEKDYKELVELLFDNVDSERIVWISMGGFRYSPGFKERIQDIFPDEEMTAEEMFPGVDGKYRYLKNKRVDIYNTLKRYINSFTEKPFLYLCMETGDVWNSVFNKYYTSSEMLEKDFSGHLKKHFL